MKTVKETRATCQSCQHVWPYTDVDAAVEKYAQNQPCPCLNPFQPKSKTQTNNCPKCNSQNITREEIEHEVEE